MCNISVNFCAIGSFKIFEQSAINLLKINIAKRMFRMSADD